MYRILAVAPAGVVFFCVSASPAAELDGIAGSTNPNSTMMAAPPVIAAGGVDHLRPRSFPEQPPTTPHSIYDDYTFGYAENRCLLCHGNAAPVDMTAVTHAPKVSSSHLVSRDGQTASEVTAGHRFCGSCHVVQTEVSPPVSNTFHYAERGRR